jgi:HK97 family phage prohead protease
MADPQVARAAAAQARREAAEQGEPTGGRLERSASPLAVGVTRSLTFPTEFRAITEQRNGTPMHHLSGVASVTETPYEMWDLFGPYVEKVSASAFDASLSRQPDVAFLVNHKGLTMARTRKGTLELGSSDRGLGIEAWLNPQRSDVRDLIVAIEDGCVDQMSFAAVLEHGEWSEDYTEFTMVELDLHCGDVSAVNFGANPHTTLSARAHQTIDETDRLPEGAARAVLRKLEARFGTTPHVDTAAPESNGRSLSIVRSALLADFDD